MQDALLAMDGAALSVEQLDALSRAVPDDSERRDIVAYLQVLLCFYGIIIPSLTRAES